MDTLTSVKQRIHDLSHEGLDLLHDPSLSDPQKKSKLNRIESEIRSLNKKRSDLEFEAERDSFLRNAASESEFPEGRERNADGTRFNSGDWGAKVVGLGPARGKALAANGSVATTPAFDPSILGIPDRPRFLRQVIPTKSLDSTDRFSYMKQTVRTNNAAAVAIGATKPTSIYTVEKVEGAVTTLAHLSERIPRQYLADAPFLRSFVETEMRLGLVLEEEDQILNGDGIGANLTGILNTTGTQTQAYNADVLNQARAAITKLELENLSPDAFVYHPTDWEAIETTQDSDTNYKLNNGPVDRAQKRLWGVRVITSSLMTQGVGLLGDFSGSCFVAEREGATLDWSENTYDSAAGVSDFERNFIRFRAEERLGFAVTRPSGFVEIDLTAV